MSFVLPKLRTARNKLRISLARRRRRVYGALCGMLVVALVGATLTGSWVVLIAATYVVATIVAALLLEVRRLRRRMAGPGQAGTPAAVRSFQARVVELEQSQSLLALTLYDHMKASNDLNGWRLPAGLVAGVARALLDRGEVLDAYVLLSNAKSLATLDKTALRKLRNELRRWGYLGRALEVAQVITKAGGGDWDVRTRRSIEGEIAVLSGEFVPVVRPEDPGFEPRVGRVLHVVGNSLPHTQSGYTLRTHYTAVAQRQAGLDPHVVTQMGFGLEGEDYAREGLDGITYHRIPGPVRGSEPLDVWMRRYVQRLANVVRVVRPAVLHAASDFINAQAAQVVGKEFGIPVVYESRGFWEETWLSRQAQTFGWDDLARLEAAHGLPDVYRWRREIEDRCRRQADRVVTLADGMADRIEAGGVDKDKIVIVPNGVDVEAFPVLSRNRKLAAELGIGEDATVVGYISSLVEYEGIDTLIAAYAAVKASSATSVTLLIVGDGAEREHLMRQAETLGLQDAIFTGRVGHDVVLDYYSLIDIFVVPRKPVEVCHLVTPLKPFEALSTGRTVVLSNVRALARIAEQSSAAELFEAGDEQSLASVLIALVKDPQRREQLATAGAAWVRAERTWAANADAYVRLYEQIGAMPLGATRIPRLTVERIDIDKLRECLAAREPIVLEVLAKGDRPKGADRIMQAGWSPAPSAPVVKLDLPIDWTTLWISNRTWNFMFHSWNFMGPVLRQHAVTGERRYLDWCIDRAVSWARTFNMGDARGTMAWYDMALGYRCHRLAYIVEQAVTHRVELEKIFALLACVIRHQQELFEDRAFNARNNHGVYVALGQLALARRLRPLLGMDVMEAQGRARLELMIRAQFAADGGHLEHSPEYHEMLLTSLTEAVNTGLHQGDELRRRLALAEDVLGWFIQPNGELAQVGDSQARQMNSRVCPLWPTTDFLASTGRRGAPDDRHLRVLAESGYAIVRYPQPQGTADHETSGYLLLSAGFHSRTHKHADDLAIMWFDRGREILIDAGRYGYVDLLPADSPLRQQGYFYGASERQYVESTRAHNTVEADGVDHVRRGREPYGSAIIDAEERDGHFRLRAEVDHGNWRHHRKIIFRPGHWLYVVDAVNAQDGGAHDLRVWWNLPEDRVPRPTEHGGLAIDPPDSVGAALWVSELSGSRLIPPVTALLDPMRGWRSKFDLQLTPAWSTGFEMIGVREHEFRTIFSFGAEPPATLFDNPFGQ